ncbi:MAG TPA: Asp-tRNA(Asn)/Glu-tRNA(Gln) amidotransferase GatCAB subunit C [Clostridiales bacterium]|nr:Asp-tRNA(Asn)/Glu-tRNA(Gln) amidotransferase GatCAB subunit C [Clostridiales bacterium]
MIDIRDYEAMEKLSLSEAERNWVSSCAELLLKSFDELEKIEADVDPLITVLDILNIFREDVAVKKVSREEILSNAPEQYDGYIQVPKTLE